MGQVKALSRKEIKRALRPNQTMHNLDYDRIAALIYDTRKGMDPGQIHQDVTCPICGNMNAFVLCSGINVGKVCIATCPQGCFECWE